MVLFAVRVSGGVGRNSLVPGSRVAFVKEIGGGSNLRVFGHLRDVMIVERTFCCDVVLQCHDSGHGTLGGRTSGTGDSKYGGVRDITHILSDSTDGVEWC